MRKSSRWIPIIGGAVAGGIIALVIALVVAGTNGSTTRSTTTTIVQTTAGRTEPTAFSDSQTGKSINQIYKQDSPGVVDILVTSNSSSGSSLFGGGQSEGEGAGVVYDAKGDIITDEHVIAGATKVVVTFSDGKTARAKVLGSDPSTDVGVIKVDVPSSELHPIKFANSSAAQVGDPVLAIGSPFSKPGTATSGIVSFASRSITAPNQCTIPGSIQTDAAINPGNSGGPLLNAVGEVLGLNDQIETDNTNSQTGEGSSSGIGFATPANADVQVADTIIAGKKVTHAFLGVSLAQTGGAVVKQIQKGSPGAVGGLKVSDDVVALDGMTITSTDQLIATLDNRYRPGQTVTLTVHRQGQTKQIQVKLGVRPATCGS